MARARSAEAEAFTYTVVFEPDEAGGYVVSCLALPRLVTEGDAREGPSDGSDATKGYLESLRKHGEQIPLSDEYETPPIRESATVRLEDTGRAGCPLAILSGNDLERALLAHRTDLVDELYSPRVPIAAPGG